MYCGDLEANTIEYITVGPMLDKDDADSEKTDLTIEYTDIYLSKNGGAKANPNDQSTCTEDANGIYRKQLNGTDKNTEGLLTVYIHFTDCLYIRQDYTVLSQAAYASKYTPKDTGLMDVHTKTIQDGIIDQDTLAADIGSTAYASNKIALAVRKALDILGLDHLVAGSVAGADVADNSIFAKLVSASGTADWDTFVNTTDSLQAIKDAVVAANPQAHNATANAEIGNTTLDGGDYTNTYTDDASYYQTGPGAAVGGFGLNCNLTFGISTGRVPIGVIVDGHFAAGGQRTVEVWAYDYILSAYIQLSNSANDFGHSPATDTANQYAMTANMVKISDGEVSIRFTSTSETGADVWNCGHVEVSSIAQAAAGLTADAIQAAVWSRSDAGHDHETLGHNLSSAHTVDGLIVSVTSASQFKVDTGVGNNDAYNGHILQVEDLTDGHKEMRRVVDYVGADKEIFLDRALSFAPVAGDHVHMSGRSYADVNVTHSAGTAQTANDNGLDINQLLVNLGITDSRVVTLQSDMDDVISGAKPVIEGTITSKQLQRVLLCFLSGATTVTLIGDNRKFEFKDQAGDVSVITMNEVDQYGQRESVDLDFS